MQSNVIAQKYCHYLKKDPLSGGIKSKWNILTKKKKKTHHLALLEK